MSQQYPLAWPAGWPRTKFPTASRFLRAYNPNRPGGSNRRHTIAEAQTKLRQELERLGASKVVVSSNMVLNKDGSIRGSQAMPPDRGVAVYFNLKERALVLACDRWTHVECNLWAIASHVETMRQQERWGVGNTQQAFAGYLALEQKTQATCWEVLDVDPWDNFDTLKTKWRALVARYHADGTEPNADKFQQVQEAYRVACETIKP